MRIATLREVDALVGWAWKHFDVKFEERSRLRRQEAPYRRNPLHDAHVKAFWAQRPSGALKQIRECKACGHHKPLWLWPRLEGGAKIGKHCGCGKARFIDLIGPAAAERRRVAARRRYAEGDGQRERVSQYRQANQERIKQIQRDYATRNKERRIEQKRAWRARRAATLGKTYRPYAVLCEAHVRCWVKQLERLQAQAIAEDRSRYAPHAGHVSAWRASRPADAYRHRYRTDAAFNAQQKVRARLRIVGVLDGRMAAHFAMYVKQGSLSAAWEKFLGYDYDALAEHLRRTLPRRYTWEAFLRGRLHIDHIVPRSAFDLTDPDEVRRCWALSNLRLLPAAANLRKRDRREYLL